MIPVSNAIGQGGFPTSMSRKYRESRHICRSKSASRLIRTALILLQLLKDGR